MDTMTAQASQSTQPDDQEAAGKEPTALLPKSILAGKDFKPGEEVVLKVLRILDDQVEVAYATGEGSKEESPEPGPEMDSAPPAPAGNPNYE